MKFMKHGCLLIILALSLWFAVAGASAADPLNIWRWRNPLPQGNNLKSVAYGNGMFVAVGTSGTIVTSPDGIHWVTRTNMTRYQLSSVTFGNNIFVAVGWNDGEILTSADGVTWSAQNLHSPYEFNKYHFSTVVYGKGKFVALGDTEISCGSISAISTDGISWTTTELSGFCPPAAMAYGNGEFVAVGSNGESHVSVDGVKWTGSYVPAAGELKGISFGKGVFVAVGDNYSVFTSVDGISWEDWSITDTWSTVTGITYGNGQFVLLDKTADPFSRVHVNEIFTSIDGKHWTQRDPRTNDMLYGVVYGGGKYVAVGEWGRIISSTDGISWVSFSGPSDNLYGITRANGLFFAVSDGKILKSVDGIKWTSMTANSYSLYGLTYGKLTFVAVGRDNFGYEAIVTSTDGVTWINRTAWKNNGKLLAVTYANGIFVAVGEAGVIRTSVNGVTWTPQRSGSGADLWGVSYGSGKFVAVGRGAEILSSIDGVLWQPHTTGTNVDLYGVTYGEGKFVAVGGAKTILTSRDGMNWILRNTVPPSGYKFPSLFGVTYGYGTFVAVGWLSNGYQPFNSESIILTSKDGITWAALRPKTNNCLYGVAYGGGKFVTVGVGGTILQSNDIR